MGANCGAPSGCCPSLRRVRWPPRISTAHRARFRGGRGGVRACRLGLAGGPGAARDDRESAVPAETARRWRGAVRAHADEIGIRPAAWRERSGRAAGATEAGVSGADIPVRGVQPGRGPHAGGAARPDGRGFGARAFRLCRAARRGCGVLREAAVSGRARDSAGVVPHWEARPGGAVPAVDCAAAAFDSCGGGATCAGDSRAAQARDPRRVGPVDPVSADHGTEGSRAGPGRSAAVGGLGSGVVGLRDHGRGRIGEDAARHRTVGAGGDGGAGAVAARLPDLGGDGAAFEAAEPGGMAAAEAGAGGGGSPPRSTTSAAV